MDIKFVNCIPTESKCPLTNVKFDESNNLVTSSDPTLGQPVIDLFLSENGPPCVHWDTNFNTYTNKTMEVLFNPQYIRGCPPIEIDG
jgi:hypothetical protein